MKNKIFPLLIILLILSACTLEGVKEKKKVNTTDIETETVDSTALSIHKSIFSILVSRVG
jgi:outer membrane biogenesis lipoprotein LolB